MADITPNFEPYSDIAISNEETISSHSDYIKQGKYEEAQTLVNNDESMNHKGIRASFFNAIENKIKELQIYLLNKVAAPDEYYSIEEPTKEFMEQHGYIFWIKVLED